MNWLSNGLPSGGGGGGVTSVTAQSPLVVGGSATDPQISIPKADENTDGYLSAADWKKFDEKQPAGNYITELTGDVVAQGPVGGGAAPTTIQDKVVTFNKIQDVSSGTLLGRSTAGSGSVEEIAIGSGLELANGTLSVVGGGGGGGTVTKVTSLSPELTVANETTTPELTLHVGDGPNTVAAGDDPRIVGAVQRTGDTMTGPLELLQNGLKVGSEQLVATGDKIGIGTDSPSVLLDVAGTVKIGDGGETCSMGEDGGMIRYFGGNLQFCNGSTWQTLGVSGAGLQSLNGQTGSTQELKVEITGTAPKFTSASDVHTLELPMASSAGVTAGLISNADYETFSSKLDSDLPAGNILVGDGNNKAQAVLPSGDVTISQAGEFMVEKLRGTPLDAAAPVAGQVLKYDVGISAWTPSYLTVSDLRSGLGGIGAPQFPSSCSKSETLTWNAITDQFVCQSIEITASQAADLGTMATKDADDYLTKDGNLAGLADPDVALANLGVTETGIDLLKAQDAAQARSAIEAMEYVAPGTDGHILTVDNGKWVSAPLSISTSNFGPQQPNHVLAGPESGGNGAPSFRALVPADIPDLPASKIATGTLSPSVMPEFTGDIATDAGSTNAKVVGLQGRSVASAAPGNGQVLKWNGSAWAPAYDEIGSGVVQVETGSGLTGGPITTTGTIEIATGGVQTSHLANGAVTADKIGDGEVTDAKIAAVSDTKLTGTIKVISGNVGIGTATPEAKLDVDGDIRANSIIALNGIKIGTSNADCDSAVEGAIRYNATEKNLEFCNGEEWVLVGAREEEGGGSSIACPAGYIPVPGNPEFGTQDFCVAKYEMKDVGGVATSQAAGAPWVFITRNNARAKCAALGAGYSLITNAQWQTIARNIEQVAENWQNGAVGSGALNRGHSDVSPDNALAASTDDNQACSGTGQSCDGSSWDLQKRTHKLSNGEVIWDFAGNVWEWVYDDYSSLNVNPSISTGYKEYNNTSIMSAHNRKLFGPSNTSWTSTQGIGQIFGGSAGAVRRGGGWYYGTYSGVFAATLDYGPAAYSDTDTGFRCVWSP